MFSAMTWMKKRWGSNKEAASMALKVTSAQLKAIFALSRKLGMDMEDLHGMAYRISGTDSLRTAVNLQSRWAAARGGRRKPSSGRYSG